MLQLDGFDRKILDALQENGRITTQELSERVGLSATPCARRIKRMEDDGLIDRYVTLLNPERLGLALTVFVNVRLNTQSAKTFDAFEDAIRKLPEVVGCYLLAGNYDYLVQVRVADVEAFRTFIRDRLVTIDGIGETQSNVVLEETKHTTALPLNL
jgi:Lrp/AsnC family leucine-responsive transcriptional regulator